jgi:hypothetical protein
LHLAILQHQRRSIYLSLLLILFAVAVVVVNVVLVAVVYVIAVVYVVAVAAGTYFHWLKHLVKHNILHHTKVAILGTYTLVVVVIAVGDF